MTVPARPASSVVLVRPPATGTAWETYLLRRTGQSPVLADMWVFPGGTIRADDRAEDAQLLAPKLTAEAAHAALSRAPGQPPATQEESYAYHVAAARELLEEAGIMLTSQTELPVADELAAMRLGIEQGEGLARLVGEHGITMQLESLVYYAHWITPEPLPARFDTRFFIAVLPEGQEPSPSQYEMVDGTWIDAATALSRAKDRTLGLHFATLSHLRRLAPYETLEELLSFARTKTVVPVMPSVRDRDGAIVPFLPPELQDAW